MIKKMKSIQSKNITPTNSNHFPFFQKESGNNFFNGNGKSFFNSNAIQAKLIVDRPDDPYEKEADAMADKIVERNKTFDHSKNYSTSFFNGSNTFLQRECSNCEQEEKLQKKENENEQDSPRDERLRKPIFENEAKRTELIQPITNGTLIQRAEKGEEACARYEKGEVEKSHTEKGYLDKDAFFPTAMSLISKPGELIIADFGVDWGSVKDSAKSDPFLQSWIQAFEDNPDYSLEIRGYSDCTGVERHNEFLRKRRATKIFQLLNKSRSRVISYIAAPSTDYLVGNEDAGSRAINRGVAIRFSRSFAYPPDTIEVDKPKPPKPKPKTPIETPGTQDCDTQQVEALARGFTLAKKMVHAALGEFDNDALLEKYFGKDALAHRYHIEANFVEISSGLNWDPTFECEEAGSFWCKGAVARTVPVVGWHIHICPSAIAKGDDYLARTIVHEAAHAFAFLFIPDNLCEGGWPSSKSTEDAETNADCYGEFAGDALKI
jgi:outer membrane protein OmpA-like peptidoglycan-associated protein